jgi:hypothetical protein
MKDGFGEDTVIVQYCMSSVSADELRKACQLNSSIQHSNTTLVTHFPGTHNPGLGWWNHGCKASVCRPGGLPTRWLRRCVCWGGRSGLKGGLALLSALVRLRSFLTGRSKSFSLALACSSRLLRWHFNWQLCVVREVKWRCRRRRRTPTRARYGIFFGGVRQHRQVSVDDCISAVWDVLKRIGWKGSRKCCLYTGMRANWSYYEHVRFLPTICMVCGVRNLQLRPMPCKLGTWPQ